MAKPDATPVVRRRVALDLAEGDAADRYVVLAAPPVKQADDETGYLLAGLLLGAALGAAVGLFLAPRSGEETRQAIKSRLPLVGEGAAEDAEAAPGSEPSAIPAPTNAPAGALDPVAQVAQYQTPPVAATPPPYTAGEAAPPGTP